VGSQDAHHKAVIEEIRYRQPDLSHLGLLRYTGPRAGDGQFSDENC
jgi:hypothetical protein